ncbi:MAG: thioredoxin 1 [Crocinitomicaceae bacterium]|jgi:thioredoxin 1
MFNLFKRKKRIKARFVNKEYFDEQVITQKKATIITFSAGWCGACKMQKPLINDVADKYAESGIIVGLVDIDVENELPKKFGVSSIPTTIAFQNGEPIFKKTGLLSRRNLEDIVIQLKTS